MKQQIGQEQSFSLKEYSCIQTKHSEQTVNIKSQGTNLNLNSRILFTHKHRIELNKLAPIPDPDI